MMRAGRADRAGRRSRVAGKWALRVAAVLIVPVGVYLAFLRWPYPLFPHGDRFGCCTVHSDAEFSPEFVAIMRDVNERLEACELYRPGSDSRLFYATRQSRYSIVARMARVNPDVQGFNLSQFGNTYVSQPRMDFSRHASGGFPPYGVREGSPAHVIAHELIHGYAADAIGFAAYRSLPHWKREGYAEYGSTIRAIRRDGLHSLKERIAIAEDDSNWVTEGKLRRAYYRSALLVEFLSEHRGLSFDEIMDAEVTRAEVEVEMMHFFISNGRSSRQR